MLSQFKKYHSSGNLKVNYLGVFQSSKLRNFMGKILRYSIQLNFTQNTLGCYGLNRNSTHFLNFQDFKNSGENLKSEFWSLGGCCVQVQSSF